MTKSKNVIATVSGKTAIGIAAHRFVGVADRNVLCGANAKALGVTAYAAQADEQFGIDIAGITLIELAATVAAGKPVTSDANGKAVEVAAVSSALTLATTLDLDGAVTASGAVPAGAVAVKSDAENPTIASTGTVDFTGSTAATTGTAAISGGKLPVAINGWLLEGGDAGNIVPMLIA